MSKKNQKKTNTDRREEIQTFQDGEHSSQDIQNSSESEEESQSQKNQSKSKATASKKSKEYLTNHSPQDLGQMVKMMEQMINSQKQIMTLLNRVLLEESDSRKKEFQSLKQSFRDPSLNESWKTPVWKCLNHLLETEKYPTVSQMKTEITKVVNLEDMGLTWEQFYTKSESGITKHLRDWRGKLTNKVRTTFEEIEGKLSLEERLQKFQTNYSKQKQVEQFAMKVLKKEDPSISDVSFIGIVLKQYSKGETLKGLTKKRKESNFSTGRNRR